MNGQAVRCNQEMIKGRRDQSGLNRSKPQNACCGTWDTSTVCVVAALNVEAHVPFTGRSDPVGVPSRHISARTSFSVSIHPAALRAMCLTCGARSINCPRMKGHFTWPKPLTWNFIRDRKRRGTRNRNPSSGHTGATHAITTITASSRPTSLDNHRYIWAAMLLPLSGRRSRPLIVRFLL